LRRIIEAILFLIARRSLASWIGAERLSEKEKAPVKGEYPGEGRYWSQWLCLKI